MERWAVTITGIVQGVGFRPCVHRLATARGLTGFVQNRSGPVHVEAQGDVSTLAAFVDDLQTKAPVGSRVNALHRERIYPVPDERSFEIRPSEKHWRDQPIIPADVATCDACLAELFNPTNRRYRYPFITCATCGPRLTIVQAAPYDRERTTMSRFPMCDQCRSEYFDPTDRRFHAQAIACPACGPRLSLLNRDGTVRETTAPLQEFARRLLAGEIGAIKGLGGYHLTCSALNGDSVQELRRRKLRDEKPLAVMVRDVEAARWLCEVSPHEQWLLESPQRPIVLLRKRDSGGRGWNVSEAPVSGHQTHTRASHPLQPQPPEPVIRNPSGVVEEVAPGQLCLGILLPYTPLHALLMEAVGDVPLVMTSGNRADVPIAYHDDDALARLGSVADLFLTHNRPIHVRCDDSVTRSVGSVELPIRRSRGLAPLPIPLPFECPRPILAVGGQLKGTFALGIGRQAFVSHHLGDLEHLDAWAAFKSDLRLYEDLLGIEPEVIVHDLHPDYVSTRIAQERAAAEGQTLIAVQHHHAHVASCLAEHGLNERVIGVAFDGTGFGLDGTIWGGEILVGDCQSCQRVAHLRPVPMPGGERAIREPWRMAVAYLRDAGVESDLTASLTPEQQTVRQMLKRSVNSPLTSSVGRLFDAVAAIAGGQTLAHYEGQAAMAWEGLASASREMETTRCETYPFDVLETPGQPLVLDPRPMIRQVANDVQRGARTAVIAWRFHRTLAAMIFAICQRVRQSTGLNTVVLSGGVFLNAVLTTETTARLSAAGFRVLRHQLVPPNDGGLSLGQLAVAARRSFVGMAPGWADDGSL